MASLAFVMLQICIMFMNFCCQFCSFEAPSLSRFVSHCRLHRNLPNTSFQCCFESCNQNCKNYSSLKVHISRVHRLKETNVTSDSGGTHSNTAVHTTLSCARLGCDYQFETLSELKAHLKRHLARGDEIHCPFDDCQSKFRVKSSFSAHLTRRHAFSKDISSAYRTVTQRNISIDDADNESLSDSDFDTSEETESSYLKHLAGFYLKLEAKCLIPASTIQLIVSEFEEINKISQNIMWRKMEEKLLTHLTPETLVEVKNDSMMNNLMSLCNAGPLKTVYKRNEFYKKHFGYIAPNEILLGYDRSKKAQTYQYVPLCESLTALLKYHQDNLNLTFQRTECNDSFSDVFDGNVFKNNALFSLQEPSLQVILYQDAFEVVNLLGSAKKKHKLVGVYYTLANFDVENRSNIDHMQLVLLCRETYLKAYTSTKVFEKLVNDLKHLETVGVPLNDSLSVKGSLLCIVGDNLGSHMVGGFQESFNVKHFCRYCEFSRNDGDLNARGVPRSVLNYKTCIRIVSETQIVEKGIKDDSVFNELSFYHVAMPGLPPCLGHDLFEGIVAYDMVLIVKKLINLHWFTVEQLNYQIENFKYNETDVRDKPSPFPAKSERLWGQAVQNWVFLRLFSLIVLKYTKKQDTDNQFWQLYLNLKLVVDIVCSEMVTSANIAYLNVCIEQYLCDRQRLFPEVSIRPKHHFLVHYPELIIAFGPLKHLWTMRFESKHTYFKRCARQLHNYKNICKTLASKHQLLQAFYTSGSLFKNRLIVHECANPFDRNIFNIGIQDAIENARFVDAESHFSLKVTYKGILYTPGHVIFMSQFDEGYLFGMIQFCLVKQKTLWFVVELLRADYLPSYGTYLLLSALSEYECIETSTCKSLTPVSVYKIDSSKYLVPKFVV